MKKEEFIRILYKKIGELPKEMKIENTLESKQQLVEGLIEVIPYKDALLICNEEGKINNLEPNLMFDYDYIAGNCFIAGDDYRNADFKSLTDEQVEEYKRDLINRSIPKTKEKMDTTSKEIFEDIER